MQALDSTRGAPRETRKPGLRLWNAAAIAIALALIAPIAVVGANLFVPGGEAWAHLSATVLPDYALNSLALVAMVATGTTVVGVACAWLVACCEFPGRRAARMGAGAAARDAGLRDRLRLHRRAAVRGPGAVGAARGVRLGGGRLLVPRDPLAAGRGRRCSWPCSTPTCTCSRAWRSSSSRPRSPRPGARWACPPWQAFFAREPAARAPRHRRRRRARLHGDARRLRHRVLLRRADLHHGHLPRLALDGRAGVRRASSRCCCSPSWRVLLAPSGSRGGARASTTRPRSRRRVRRARSRAAPAPLALATCLAPLALGFAIPAAMLARLSLQGGDGQFGARFAALAANSFFLASVTAVIAVALAVVMAYGARISRSRVGAGGEPRGDPGLRRARRGDRDRRPHPRRAARQPAGGRGSGRSSASRRASCSPAASWRSSTPT